MYATPVSSPPPTEIRTPPGALREVAIVRLDRGAGHQDELSRVAPVER